MHSENQIRIEWKYLKKSFLNKSKPLQFPNHSNTLPYKEKLVSGNIAKEE